MNRDQLRQRLQGGLFLSSMMGTTDGAFVAQRGAGASMVQIGALVADTEDRSHEPPHLLPETESEMASVLRPQVATIRAALGDVPVALNAAVGDIESGIRMAEAFRRAGGDIFELNIHGGYEKLLTRGLLRAMALPENRPTLIEWLRRLCRLEITVIVKFWAGMPDVDFREVLRETAGVDGLFGVHFNVRSGKGKTADLAFVRAVRPHVQGMLLCSGYVRSRADVDALLAAGADCVGLAEVVLRTPDIIHRLTS